MTDTPHDDRRVCTYDWTVPLDRVSDMQSIELRIGYMLDGTRVRGDALNFLVEEIVEDCEE